jgi:hypothetical protein
VVFRVPDPDNTTSPPTSNKVMFTTDPTDGLDVGVGVLVGVFVGVLVGVTVGVTVLVGVGVTYGDGSTNIKYSSLPTLIYSSFPAIIGSINT